MPISKDGNAYFTDDQLRYAKGQTSTLEYVRQQGYPLVKKGTYYVHAEHDSLVFAPNGSWWWNSRGLHGGALDFITQIEHKSLVEAVLILNGENVLTQSKSMGDIGLKSENPPDYGIKEPGEKIPFELPQKAANYSRLFGYLCKGRCIDSAIVQELVHEKKLYLSATLTKTGKEVNNVVFVGFDENGTPCNAYQRGTWSLEGKPAFKVDVAGSNKNYPFHMVGTGDTVMAFEGAIDAMSHATLVKQEHGNIAAQTPHRISLGGIFAEPLIQFLKTHPDIKKICLSLDNDSAGKKGIPVLSEKLVAAGYAEKDITVQQSVAKDWNTDLVAKMQPGISQGGELHDLEQDLPFDEQVSDREVDK